MAKSEKKSKRLQLELPDRSWERLDALRAKTEATSYAEVIRNALRLYEDVILRVDDECRIYIKDKNDNEIEYRVFG